MHHMDIIDHVATAPGPLACTATALGSVLVNDVWTPPLLSILYTTKLVLIKHYLGLG